MHGNDRRLQKLFLKANFSKSLCNDGIIPNFKEILSLHILQEMKHSEGVKPIGGLVYMCQHVLWVILRYFSSSLKNNVKIAKNRDTVNEKSSKLSSCISQYIP